MLESDFAPIFLRDIKKLKRKHADFDRLKQCIMLILENSPSSRNELIRHHGMHTLSGNWSGSYECHVCNAGDWLLIWCECGNTAYFQRTGSHEELFR